MSVEAIKVNELIEEAADYCTIKALAIQKLVNEEIRSPEFLMAAEGAAESLKEISGQISELTLDEEE
jgi:hypothetical protein